MLHAPTSETKTETVQSKAPLAPTSERELHPHSSGAAGAYALNGVESVESIHSPYAQRRQTLTGMQRTHGNQAVLRMLHSPQQVARMTPLRPSQGVMVQRKCACGGSAEAEGECEECRKQREGGEVTSTPLQKKLNVSMPGDIYEQEADRAAEQVMRKADSQSNSRMALSHVSDISGQTLNSQLEADIHTARGNGQVLSNAVRSSFESLFGYNFSQVGIHTDTQAQQMARSLQASAFTVGRDIYFGASQYSPETNHGRALLAHELAHTIQQGAVSAPTIQRRVSPEWPKIHSDLTYGIIDWAITDAEAHEVLVILKGLSDENLQDTVDQMEQEGLVDRLFDNLSDKDQRNEFSALERIDKVRVRNVKKEGPTTVSMSGPCSAEQLHATYDRLDDTKAWARKAKEAINDFVSNPPAHSDTANLLDRHFFHQKTQGPLTIEQQLNYAKTISKNFENVQAQRSPIPNVCASRFDPLCRALAAAYVDTNSLTTRVMFCPYYFQQETYTQTYYLLHELTHFYANVADRGYGNERIFAYLVPMESINNADSYALFALDILQAQGDKRGGAAAERVMPKDTYESCSKAQQEDLMRSFAFAARMVTNALNAIGAPQFQPQDVLTHFKTNDRDSLQRVIDRYKELNTEFSDELTFECESNCNPNVPGYVIKPWGWALHLCPSFFAISTAEDRRDMMLFLQIFKVLGLDSTATPGTSAYTNQTSDQAYDNASAYLTYARMETDRGWPQIIGTNPTLKP